MLIATTGLVMLANFVLAGVVGVRLLRLPQVDQRISPERLLAVHFLACTLVGSLLVTTAYAIWSSFGKTVSPLWLTTLHGVGLCLVMAGFAAIFFFTQRTFRPESAAARAAAWAGAGILMFAFTGRALGEGYAITLDPGPLHWLAYTVRMVGLSWVTIEALAYWRLMRRRRRLGLAEPIVVNRFLLWSFWAGGSILMATAEPVARLVYSLSTGDAGASADAIQGVAQPILAITLGATSAFGSMTTGALFLTFFPTAGYRRWLNRGGEAVV